MNLALNTLKCYIEKNNVNCSYQRFGFQNVSRDCRQTDFKVLKCEDSPLVVSLTPPEHQSPKLVLPKPRAGGRGVVSVRFTGSLMHA